MKQFSLFIHLMLSVLLFSSCGGRSKTASVIEAEKAIPLRYAENLNLSATEDYTIARLRNPWDTTRILHTYVLVDKEKSLPADLPEGTLVRTPLSKAVVYSSVHCGLLNQIGALKSIGGVCDLKYIKLQEVQDGCRTGSIADVGNGMNPDIEKIIDLHPDAIMLSPCLLYTSYNLREDNHWQPDFDELEKMDLSRVKIMWTNYPNMPTGANATMELYEKLVNFARRHNIVIVNDNPYSFILNKKPLSILNVPGAKECCIEFNSMSKSHNMPGWRVGMLATNAQFIQWILKIKSNIDSGTFRPMQLAAAQAYNNSVEWHEEANVNVYSRRRQLAEEIMKVLGCSFDPNQVGMFLWGRIPESYNDVEELTEKVLHEARVFITPGFIFGSNGKRYIRISLCAKEEKLAEALERIKKIM